jgi:hypothetical protein
MIAISEVINISVSTPPAGIAEQNVSNLACFTDETPVVTLSGPFVIYTSATDVSTDWGSASKTAKAANAVFAQSPNIISGGGKFIVIPILEDETSEECLARAIPLVFFGAFATTFTEAKAALLATGAAAQASGKLFAVSSATATDLDAAGLLQSIFSASLKNMRGLFHTVAGQIDAMKWAYLSRAMAVNFNGNNTTNTMQLKQLAGVEGDSGLTETLKEKAKAIGADCYPIIAGRPSVISYGANEFFDYVFNLAWVKMALEVAGFNVLATTSTKLPQTEPGMDLLKGGYRVICDKAVANGMAAPGAWTSPDTFGDPEDFVRNIKERGYFVYSAPVSVQAAADRDARKAPLVQIAFKMAGAVHHSDVIVNINK